MILENSLTKLQATIQFMKAKSKGPGNGAGVGKGKARGGKYYKREIVNGKLKYYYTREQYEKEHKEDKGKSESVISKFLSFFRVKPEQAFDVIEKNYEEAKPSTGVSLEEFTTYTIEYFNHKEEIDKKLQEALAKKQAPKEPKEKVEPQEAIEEDATEPKEKTPKEPREAKPKTVNAKTLVFKYWFNKLKGSQAQPTEPKETPRQEEVKKEATPTQATEDNFETMPEGESEKKQLRIREIENKINSYLRKIKNFKANSSLRPPSITIEIVKKWSSVIDKLTKEKDELLGKKSSEEYIMNNDDNHPHELPNHVLRNIENQIKKIHKEYFENEDKPKEKVNQNDLEFIKELPNDKIREALEKLDNEKLKKIRLDSDFRYKNNQNRNLQEKYLKIIVMSNEELLKRDIRLSYQEISNYSPTPSPVTVEKAVENLANESEKKSMEANPGLKMKALAQAGVKIWNNQRAYFNAKDFLDVEWDYSSKGRRRGATVEGETLSASQALSFQDSLRSAKIYYDANSDSINVDLGGLDKYITEDDVKQIVESRIDRTLKNYTPPEEKPSIQNSSTTIDQTEIDSHINTMASLQGGELKEYLDKLHYSIREQILTKESEKYKKPMTPTDETTNEYDREIVSKTRNRLMEELSKGVVAVDYTIKIHTGQDTIDEGSKRKAIFLDVIDGISKINDPKFYSQNHELTRAISSNSRSSNPALLAFSSAIKDKIKAQEKAESISKMEVKTSFDEGLEGKYNDGVLVESGQFKPEYYGGSKFYKIITPYNEAIIKKLQKYKQEVYNNHDYKARKANGVIEWVPTPTGGQKGFWRVPEAYTEYAKKILEDHLGK